MWPSRNLRLLLIVGLSAACVYGAILARLPLFGTVTQVKRDLSVIPPAEWPLGLLIGGCTLLLFAAYFLGARVVAQAWREPGVRLAVVGFPLLFGAMLVYTFPITSTDVYDYLFRGWMLAHYHSNPFTTVPRAFSSDPLLPYVAWPNAVSAYGPLWERLSLATTWISGIATGPATPDVRLVRLALGFKYLGALGVLLCGAAIWAATGGNGRRWRWPGLFLWLWNPLVLWESIGAGHNDVTMCGWRCRLCWRCGPCACSRNGAATWPGSLPLVSRCWRLPLVAL